MRIVFVVVISFCEEALMEEIIAYKRIHREAEFLAN